MRFSTSFLAVVLASVLPAALAAPAQQQTQDLHAVHTFEGRKVPGSYIVTLKPSVKKDNHRAWLAGVVDKALARITHDWENIPTNAFAGKRNK